MTAQRVTFMSSAMPRAERSTEPVNAEFDEQQLAGKQPFESPLMNEEHQKLADSSTSRSNGFGNLRFKVTA